MGILDFFKKGKQSRGLDVIVNGKKYKTSIDCSDEEVKQRKRAATPDEEGCRRVDIKSFFDKYSQYDCIPDDLFDNLQHRFIHGFSYADIPEGQIKLVEGRYERRKAENERLCRCTALNNEGIQYEKQGEIDKAINVYEQNITDGYPATHSYDRLMILYRKRKEYDKEMAVIEKAIEIFPSQADEYRRRLEKASLLNAKSQTKIR